MNVKPRILNFWVSCLTLLACSCWAALPVAAQDLPDLPSGNSPGSHRVRRGAASTVHSAPGQLAVPLDAELILADDFAEMHSGWPIGESPTAVWGYNRGSYMISLRGTGRVRTESDNVVEQGIMVPKVMFRDFCLDFSASLQSTAFSYMEVRFRTSHKGFYTLAFNTRKMFSLTRFDGQYRTLLPFRKSESLQQTSNDFRILVEGGRILIYANGIPIAACKDSAPLPQGGLVYLAGLASGSRMVDSTLLIKKVRLYALPLVQGEPRTDAPMITSNTPLPKQPNAPDVNSESSEGAIAESPYAPPSRQNNHSAADAPLPSGTMGEPPPSTLPPPPGPAPTVDTTPPAPEPVSPAPVPPDPATTSSTSPAVQTIPTKDDLASTAMGLVDPAAPSTSPTTTPAQQLDPARQETAALPDDRASAPAKRPKAAQKPAAVNNIPVPGADVFPLKAGNYWIFEGIVRYDPPEGSVPLTNPNPATTSDDPAPTAATPQLGKRIEKTVQLRMEVLDTAVVNGWGFAQVKGYPSELASYEEGRERADSLIVRDPEGRYYLVQPEDMTTLLVTLQGGSMDRFEKPKPDDLILAPPFNLTSQFGNEEVLKKPGTINRWVFTGEGATKVSHIQGLANVPGANDARPMYTLEFRTNPDVTTVEFAPGVGILGYKYKHIGSSTECDVRLIGCRLKQ